jgi:pimeloyl-ACP methyl ester carboxylesterase
LHDPDIKRQVLRRLGEVVTPETRVLIGHSLGSIVAYEGLCANPQWKVSTFVTIGSPLGIPRVVFDVLTPRPSGNKGVWPHVKKWTNIADRGDIVALTKQLAPLFPPPPGAQLTDFLIYNGWESHDATRYLSAAEVGRAVAEGLLAE